MRPIARLLARLCLILGFLTASAAQAAPTPVDAKGPLVLAAASLQESLTAAADRWARLGHPRPVLSFAASSALARQIVARAPADLFVSADEEWMDAVARAGMVALCVADQGGTQAYYKFVNAYFAQTGGNGRGLPGEAQRGRAAVVDVATAAGATDGKAVEACTRSKDTLDRLVAEGDAAERATVQGTPAVAVRNNVTGETILVDGAIDGDTLDAAIALMATRSNRQAPPPPGYSR